MEHDSTDDVGVFRAQLFVGVLADVEVQARIQPSTSSLHGEVDHGKLGHIKHFGDISNQLLWRRTNSQAIVDIVETTVVGRRYDSAPGVIDTETIRSW